MKYRAEIKIMPKKGVLDPQGEAVKGALKTLGYDGVHDVRIGKYLVVLIDGGEKILVENKVKEMCDKLLSNLVIEEYSFSVKEIPV